MFWCLIAVVLFLWFITLLVRFCVCGFVSLYCCGFVCCFVCVCAVLFAMAFVCFVFMCSLGCITFVLSLLIVGFNWFGF